MLEKKFLRILLLSLACSSLLLIFSQKSLTEKEKKRPRNRLLLGDDQKKEIEEICKKSKGSINDYYLKGIFPGDKVKTDENAGESEDVKMIIGLINGTSGSKDLVNYAMKVLVWVVFIAIGILVIPSWIFCCCCCCCPMCCCRQSQKHEYVCRLVSFIIFATMFGIVISVSIYGFFGLNGIIKGFNGTSCSVMKLYIELVEGQAIQTSPKWIGVQGLQNTIDDLIDTVNQIKANTQQVTSDKNEINDLQTSHDTLMQTAYTNVKDLKIEFNNPYDSNNKATVIPTYVTNYGPDTTSNTALNAINKEFSEVMKLGKQLVEKTAEAGGSIKEKADDINRNLGEVKKIILNFGGTFDSFSDTVIDPWLNYQDKINHYGTLGFRCFFGVFLGIGVGIAALVVVFVLLGIKLLKLFIHILWNILVLVTFLTFIFGSVFGLIGTVGKTATEVMIYVISPENLNKGENADILPGEASHYLSICITGNGDLSSQFSLGTAGNNLDQLFSLQTQLDVVSSKIKDNSESIVCKQTKVQYESLKTNYLLATTSDKDGKNDFATILSECNKVSNCGSSCAQDTWVIDQSYCKSGKYKKKGEETQIPNENCLVLREWTEDEITNRYTNKEDIKKKVISCRKTFESIETENNKIISKINEENGKLEDNYKTSMLTLSGKIDNTKKIIEPVQSVFNGLLGKNSNVFSIINCSFLGGHTNLIVKELHNALGSGFYNFGIAVEVLSMASGLGVIFLIPVLNRFHKNFDSPKKKDENPNNKEGEVNSMAVLATHRPTASGANLLPETVPIQKRKSKILENGKIKELAI